MVISRTGSYIGINLPIFGGYEYFGGLWHTNPPRQLNNSFSPQAINAL